MLGKEKGAESYLNQTWARSRPDRWLALINPDTFVTKSISLSDL